MMEIRYPRITGRTEAEKIRQLESYLRTLVDQLNYALKELEKERKQ